jgi:hypothetical protein
MHADVRNRAAGRNDQPAQLERLRHAHGLDRAIDACALPQPHDFRDCNGASDNDLGGPAERTRDTSSRFTSRSIITICAGA